MEFYVIRRLAVCSLVISTHISSCEIYSNGRTVTGAAVAAVNETVTVSVGVEKHTMI